VLTLTHYITPDISIVVVVVVDDWPANPRYYIPGTAASEVAGQPVSHPELGHSRYRWGHDIDMTYRTAQRLPVHVIYRHDLQVRFNGLLTTSVCVEHPPVEPQTILAHLWH